MSVEDVIKAAQKDTDNNRFAKEDKDTPAPAPKKVRPQKIKQGEEGRALKDIPGLKARIRRGDLTATEKDVLLIFLTDKFKTNKLLAEEKDLFLTLLRIENARDHLDKVTNPIFAELEGEEAELQCVAIKDGFSPGMRVKKGMKARANYLPELDRVDVFFFYTVPGRAQMSEKAAYKVAMGIPLTDDEIPENKEVAKAIRMRKKEFDLLFQITGTNDDAEVKSAEESLFS